MKLTRENYEAWFLDYLEGRLDKQGEEEVRRFVEQNPDLGDELESFSPALVMDASITYPDKEGLKKSAFDDASFFENTAVADMEGDLSPEESGLFNKWLETNPARRAYTALLRQTRLQPDPGITFPGREKLKKRNRGIFMLSRLVAAAALLLLAFFLFLPSEKIPEPAVLTSTEPVRTIEPDHKPATDNPKMEEVSRQPVLTPLASLDKPRNKATIPAETEKRAVMTEPRRYESLQPLAAKSVTLVPDAPLYYDLVPVRVFEQVYYASNEIQLSEYLNNKLQTMKADGPKGFFSREEVAVAGLRFFSRLPGKHLTGKKGNDGKLKTISFNTQAMAFSIPVNK